MDEMDVLLGEAGRRWRAAQPEPAATDAASIARRVQQRALPTWGYGLAAAVVVVVAGAVAFQLGGTSPAGGGLSSCSVTRPEPAFTAPAPYPAAPPETYRSAWYGDARLWTMLSTGGERWDALPKGPDGYGQKTFWWSADFDPRSELLPAITIEGTRLDGTGSFTSAESTNATADLGAAMEVAVTVPTAGCWRLTAHYRAADLSYVVQVGP